VNLFEACLDTFERETGSRWGLMNCSQGTCVQATVRAPAARNMITKTLPMMYLIGTLPFLLISFIGYWAYGNGVGYNILYSNSGPTWAIALAYVAAAAQIVVSFHVSLLSKA